MSVTAIRIAAERRWLVKDVSQKKTSPPDQDDATSRANPPQFGRPGERGRRRDRKAFDRQAKSGDLAIERQATWGLSAKGDPMARKPLRTRSMVTGLLVIAVILGLVTATPAIWSQLTVSAPTPQMRDAWLRQRISQELPVRAPDGSERRLPRREVDNTTQGPCLRSSHFSLEQSQRDIRAKQRTQYSMWYIRSEITHDCLVTVTDRRDGASLRTVLRAVHPPGSAQPQMRLLTDPDLTQRLARFARP